MVKKTAGYNAGEKETAEYLTKLFETAKFEVQREMDLGDRPRYDLVVGREELGRYRRYAIELALTRDGSELRDKYDRLASNAYNRKQQLYDEYWLVSNLSMPEKNRRFHSDRFKNVRALTIKELERLLASLTPKGSKGKARTKIGKAIEANEKSIVLAVEALKLQIEDKLAKLRDERPNDPDAIKKVDASIAEFQAIQAKLERIRVAVQQFKKNEVKEKEVVETVGTLKDTVSKWWRTYHDTIYTDTSKSALFVGLTSLLHVAGADSGAALAILGGLIGGETIGKVLKSIPRGIFTKHN